MTKLDYQEKIWGGSEVRLSPKYLAYLRLKYALSDLKHVKGKILDAGCGGGGFAKAIKHYRSDLEVYGIDISKKAIAHAKKDSLGVNFKVGDLYSLPFEDGFFEAVVIEDVLEHLEKPYLALAEINRVLDKDGVFSAFIPLEGSPFSLHFWLEKIGWKAKERLAGHIQKFNKPKLRSGLIEAGLEVDETRHSVHLLGQLVDVAFFTLLDWTGRKLEVGLEQDLKDKPIQRFIKNTITSITNLESQILNFIPGAGVHIKCVKKS